MMLSSCALCAALIAGTGMPIGMEVASSDAGNRCENVFAALEKMDVQDLNFNKMMDEAGAEVVAIIKGKNGYEARDMLRPVRKEIILHGLMQSKDCLWPNAKQARSALTGLLSTDGQTAPVVELWKLSKDAKSESMRQAAKQTITRSVCVDGNFDRSDILTVFKMEQDPRMRELYAKHLDVKDISDEVINNEKADSVLKILLARAERSDTVDSLTISRMTEIAKTKGDTTLVLGGFYLGMRIEDALKLLRCYLPNEEFSIPEKIFESGQKAEIKCKGTEMSVCKASKDGVVREFRFPDKLLRCVLNYDATSYDEWAAKFGRENGFAMRAEKVTEMLEYTAAKLKLDGLGTIDALPSHATLFGDRPQKPIMDYGAKLASQDSYLYRNVRQGYEVRFYGACSNKDELRKEYTDGSRALLVRASLWDKWINGKGAEEGTLRISQINYASNN